MLDVIKTVLQLTQFYQLTEELESLTTNAYSHLLEEGYIKE